MNDVLNFLNLDSSSKQYIKYISPMNYGLHLIKDLKEKDFLSYYGYASTLDAAFKYNPSFAKGYLKALLTYSPISSDNLFLYNEIKNHIYKDTSKSKYEIKYKFQDIFTDHWDGYVEKFSKVMTIPEYVFDNVERMMKCKTSALGYTLYECSVCNNYKILYHTCKSRFCSSCGTKYAKERADEISKKTLKVKHRHLVFTIPKELRDYFKNDRELFDVLFKSVKKTIDWMFNEKRESKRVDKSKAYTVTPGYIQVLHTFGRDLKFNPHIHILITEGGIDSRTDKFKCEKYFNYHLLRKSFQKIILDELHSIIGKKFFPLKNKLFSTYKDGFYVYAPPQKFKSIKEGIEYVVRYTGRPVMAESRITNYDGENVTYWYNPHEAEDKTVTVTEHVYKFMGKLISHIPKKNYKTVRYYGAYAAKNHKYEGKVKKLYSSFELDNSYILRGWRLSIIYTFNNDPLKCECGSTMERTYSLFPEPKKGGVIYEIYYKKNQERYVPKNWEQKYNYSPHN